MALLTFSLALLGFLLEILVGSKLGGEQGYLLVGQLRVQVVLHGTALLLQEVDGALPSYVQIFDYLTKSCHEVMIKD